MTFVDVKTGDLWAAYKRDGQHAARDELILHYAPLVHFVAGRMGVGLPGHVERADLVSYGIFGLIDAVERFDPDRGCRFETYAIARIKGNILDELRSLDWVPRSVRAKARAHRGGRRSARGRAASLAQRRRARGRSRHERRPAPAGPVADRR